MQNPRQDAYLIHPVYSIHKSRYLAEQKMIQEVHDEASLRAANALLEGDETDDSGEEEDALVPNKCYLLILYKLYKYIFK